MSFDLYVWNATSKLSAAEAQLAAGQIARGASRPPSDPAIDEFVRRLSGLVDLGDIEHEIGEGYVILNIPWDRVDKVATMAQNLTIALKLTLYDPQNGILVQSRFWAGAP